MMATTAMVMLASDADDGNHDDDDHHHRDHDDAVLYNAALALMQGGGQGHAAAFKLLARCSYVQVSSSNTHLHWTNAGPRHTHRLPALSLLQRCSFFYWLRVCECCTHVCRFPCCRSRVMFVTLTVFCSTEERAQQCFLQLNAGGSLPSVQNHPAATETAPLPTCFFRAP